MVKKFEGKKQENLENLLSDSDIDALQGKLNEVKKQNKKAPERDSKSLPLL